MTTPDAEDASPSPEYTGDLDETDMAAEQESDHQSDGASPDQKPSKPVYSAKDPLRPRRKKARRACFACQRAHLTCGDERPCNRCVKRNIGAQCMDGVRKKAKYLHDAPEGALMPGVGGHYPYMNGNRPTPHPDPQPVSVAQASIYSQSQANAFYSPGGIPTGQDGRPFSSHQSPISPPYTQSAHGSMSNSASAMPQTTQMQQFPPLFDPSDPALFNFDISNLNFGNHYGALEFGMLGHMSSGAGEVPGDVSMMNAMNPAGNMYNPQMGYAENANHNTPIGFASNGMLSEWEDQNSRHGSLHVHTPNNNPASVMLDGGLQRHDTLTGPHAFAIGQGHSNQTTASPASTDTNSAFEGDIPLAAANFFNNAARTQTQRSPKVDRRQQEKRNTALQPIHSNGIRKRQHDTRAIYQGITKPYDYVKGFHRLYQMISKRWPQSYLRKAQEFMNNYRPVLLQVREELNTDDLIHQEMGLQRNLMTLQEHVAEVGTPFLICRRSGEILGINKEFSILTGWRREVLLGTEPNLNTNIPSRDASTTNPSNTHPNNNSNVTATTTGAASASGHLESDPPSTDPSPNIPAQQEGDADPVPLNVIELMDPRSALDFLHNFSELCWQDSRGHASQRVNMLRYTTRDGRNNPNTNPGGTTTAAADVGQQQKQPPIKVEGAAVHQGESAMQRLGAKSGLVDCMVWWHLKRDIFDMPVLVCMSVMPVLDKGVTH